MSLFLLAVCCSISGDVRAVSGAPLAAAHVEARTATSAQTTTTDESGHFSFVAPPGTYRIAASERGYAPVTVSVAADKDVTVAIALEPLDSPKLRQIGHRDGRRPARADLKERFPSVSRSYARRLRRVSATIAIIDALTATLPGTTFARPDGGAGKRRSPSWRCAGPIHPSRYSRSTDSCSTTVTRATSISRGCPRSPPSPAIDVTEGLGPEDTNGSNTFGGAINLLSLRPTKDPHESVIVSRAVPSTGRNRWFNATGTQGRLGYAFALDDQNENGYVDTTVPLYSSANGACAPCAVPLGSSAASHAALGTLTYSFSQNADVTARYFVLGDDRDQSSALSGIDRNDGSPTFGSFVGPGEQTFAQSDARVSGARAVAARRGRTHDRSLDERQFGRDRRRCRFAVRSRSHRPSVQRRPHVAAHVRHVAVRRRRLHALRIALVRRPGFEPVALGQTIDVLYLRGGFEPVAKLRLDAGVFESRYTTFGSNLDGRFGAIYTLDPATSVRFSLGTGFRAPLLIERYKFAYDALPLDANGVFIGQGSPGEHPEHATEYELGISHEFSHRSTLDVSLYRTNLRDPVEIFYPLAAVAAGTCAGNSVATPNPACVSYNGNVGNAVYQGAEFRYSQAFVPQHVLVTARYGLNVAYPKNLNAQFSNPTSAGNLIDDTQFLGIPQQQASLQADYDGGAWHAAAAGFVRGEQQRTQSGAVHGRQRARWPASRLGHRSLGLGDESLQRGRGALHAIRRRNALSRPDAKCCRSGHDRQPPYGRPLHRAGGIPADSHVETMKIIE